MKRIALFALLALASCEKPKRKLPDLPEVDVGSLPLPKSSDGKLVLFQIPEAELGLDPTVNDAITGLGRCTDLVSYCFDPVERSLDTCVESAPTCQTRTPWTEEACCPKSCADAYFAARKRLEPLEAFETAFFLEPDCYPGVKEALEGRP